MPRRSLKQSIAGQHKRPCESATGGIQEGPTLFDFVNPLELSIEATAAATDPQEETGCGESELRREHNIENNSDDVTAELVRLFQESPGPQRQEQPENGHSPVREE